ncbi:uncharacterized protein MELLADRAFT_86950 [Melampsora larici-populina 98AG31]|uniref:Alpha-type protein kinase domain-containing protein n=1 Tax=Melampsora larici-populina (strain 98AG31 / pathotype 3-4-7) TaxID=747676 RepID=F4R3Z1_MELLP|nr:uncharacterized protein MELLADRAFT_86950 [Melampsora larici-populina 98AG31]EGG13078.1 hypothetical protein MELLADRAFT_86950 [Melampsora larici-populina 98AG31]
MRSRNILDVSGEAMRSESTATEEASSTILTFPSSFIEVPITRTSSTASDSSAAVHGSVGPADDVALTETEVVGTTVQGPLIPTSRTVIKVRAPRALRHAKLEGAGSVIQVSVPRRVLTFRLDSPAKRAAFLYELKDFYEHGRTPSYVPDGGTGFTEAVVVYGIGRKVDLSLTRDVNDWCVRELQGDGDPVPYKGIVRFHSRWSCSARSGRDHALELVNAHAYVATMLELFKARLRKLWHDQEVREFQEWFLRSYNLHVHRVFLMQTIGSLDDDLPRWVMCETARDSSSKRYVYPSCFRDTMPPSNTWKHYIYAFIHYVYQKSGGVTVIGQIDCDETGNISSVVCFNKGSYHLENHDSTEQFFFDFKAGHNKCNQICHELGLKPLSV